MISTARDTNVNECTPPMSSTATEPSALNTTVAPRSAFSPGLDGRICSRNRSEARMGGPGGIGIFGRLALGSRSGAEARTGSARVSSPASFGRRSLSVPFFFR